MTMLTVKEAASIANVSTRTIYYHIYKSGKLEFVVNKKLNNNRLGFRVSQESLERLYYKVDAGRKQHTALVKPISEVDISIRNAIDFLKANGYVVLTHA